MTGALDRRALTVLGSGHMCIDLCQGAVPALLPFLAVQRGYSYAALGALLLFSTVGSSIVQPLFGILSDRVARPWLMPGGLATAGIGISLTGVAPSYGLLALAVIVSGLGVAMFHPEGAKFAGLASREQRGRGMSLFSVGGNAGFAIGPLLTTPLVLAFGLPGTLVLLVFPVTAAVVTARELPRLRRLEDSPAPPARGRPGQLGRVRPPHRLIAARSGVHFGVQAFVPAYFVAQLATSEATGNAALTLFLAAGALGTLVGGGLVDRWGARTVLVGTMVAILPLLLLLPLVAEPAAMLLVGTIGFFTIASFSVTVVLGQAYLPNHVGLASGVTLGLAIGLGGVMATALGVVADTWGVETVLWTIAVLPVPAILLAISLPAIPAARRPRAPVRVSTARPGNQESQ